MSRGMTKVFLSGVGRVGAPGFLIGRSNESQSGRRKWRRWTTQTKRPFQPQFELILVNNTPLLEERLSSTPLNFDCRLSATFICREMVLERKQ